MGFPYPARGDYMPYSRPYFDSLDMAGQRVLLPQRRSPFIPTDLPDEKVCTCTSMFMFLASPFNCCFRQNLKLKFMGMIFEKSFLSTSLLLLLLTVVKETSNIWQSVQFSKFVRVVYFRLTVDFLSDLLKPGCLHVNNGVVAGQELVRGKSGNFI